MEWHQKLYMNILILSVAWKEKNMIDNEQNILSLNNSLPQQLWQNNAVKFYGLQVTLFEWMTRTSYWPDQQVNIFISFPARPTIQDSLRKAAIGSQRRDNLRSPLIGRLRPTSHRPAFLFSLISILSSFRQRSSTVSAKIYELRILGLIEPCWKPLKLWDFEINRGSISLEFAAWITTQKLKILCPKTPEEAQ